VSENVKVLKERGFKEVVLTGIHLGAYGLDLDPPFPLEKLIKQLEKEKTLTEFGSPRLSRGFFSRAYLHSLRVE